MNTRPPKPYAWPNDAHLALSIVVNLEEGAEANILDGDKYPEPVDEMGIALRQSVRSLINESNYQYGIKRGGPRVLRLLEHSLRFLCRCTCAFFILLFNFKERTSLRARFLCRLSCHVSFF